MELDKVDKNWRKKKDPDGNTVLNAEGEPVLEEVFSVETGKVFSNNRTKVQDMNMKVMKSIN